MTFPPQRLGWQLINEPAPSLCKHFIPISGHTMSVNCWCEPAIQGEPFLNPPYSIVHHNNRARA